jgi:chain length determinant protein tyrosine kinase EpsG
VGQIDLISEEVDSLVPARAPGERSLGAILIRAGRLTPETVAQVMQLQNEQGLRFGDAAIKLGLLTSADIAMALARQFDHPFLVRGESKVSEEVVAAYTPFNPQVEALRALRAQLSLRWFDGDPLRSALVILSAERGEGRSFIAANLAVIFAQLGERTLLVDADLRNPRQHDLFGLDNRAGLSAVLSGRGRPDAVQPVAGLLGLSVLTAGGLPPNPLELLARPIFSQLLAELREKFDVVILDSSAASEYADAQTVTVRTGAALVVVRKNAARLWKVRGISDSVTHCRATVVGTVLNNF